MTWYPIAYTPPQYVDSSGKPYSGAVLKAYAAETTDVIAMATGYTGVTTATSFALNTGGYPVSGGFVIIPHVQQDFKLALYPSQAAADANSGAIWTYDDIKIADGTSNSFVQTFSGDGVTTGFTLSEDLGSDENALMIFADKKFGEYVTNGSFATDTVWTKGAGWTIAAGVATATGAISTDLSQTSATPIIAGESYTITYTVTRSAGTVSPNIGGVAGTARNANGTYTETIIAGATQAITFNTAGFTGTLDVVSMHRTMAARREILRPNEFTLAGTSLTFVEAPASGTNNIIVFAPVRLVGAVGALADAAAISEANAAASALIASTAVTLAQDWAQKTTGTVDGVGYSAKYWAQQAAAMVIPDLSIGASKLSDSIVNDLTGVTAASNDYLFIADTSDSNKKKKTLISSLWDAIRTAAGVITASSINFGEGALAKYKPKTTFTPTVIGSTSAGSGTYGRQDGIYEVVGDVVFFSIYLSWTAHTGTGNLKIGNLPLSAGSYYSTVSVYNSGLTTSAGSQLEGYVDAGASTISLYYGASGASSTAVPMDTLVNELMISGFYFI